jgi:hypothetical protein
MSEPVRFNLKFNLRAVDGQLPTQPGPLRVGRISMKAAIPISLPPVAGPAVTERRLHVRQGDRDRHITLGPDDSVIELVQPLDRGEVTLSLSDFTAAGEGPESDSITVRFDASDFPAAKPGQLRAMAPRAVADTEPDVPTFDDETAPGGGDVLPPPGGGGGDVPPPPDGGDVIPPPPGPAPEPTPAPVPEPGPLPEPTPAPAPTPAPEPAPAPAPPPAPEGPTPDVPPPPEGGEVVPPMPDLPPNQRR